MYWEHGFPADEVKPVSCGPLLRSELDDDGKAVMGDFSLTLIDSLDTFPVFGECEQFASHVRKTTQYVSFDLDHPVSVFETTIRVLGGLLAAHVHASDPGSECYLPKYQGQLLTMAHDLGVRLLPAFDTPTGLPKPRINLRTGHCPPPYTSNAAEAGSLTLEFGLLSRLTGDWRFDTVARRAAYQVFALRDRHTGLIGMTLDPMDARWVTAHRMTGVGAHADSFYEYALKYAVLFDDDDMLNVFLASYAALKTGLYDQGLHVFRNARMSDAKWINGWVDSLSPYIMGVMVLHGDVDTAARMHQTYARVWRASRAMPSRVDPATGAVYDASYPLRPEFVEATHALYVATGHLEYLFMATEIARDLERLRTECGYSGVNGSGAFDDRMPSYFLSETVKYLHLALNPKHGINRRPGARVFSTEAHELWFSRYAVAGKFGLKFVQVAAPRVPPAAAALVEAVCRVPRARYEYVEAVTPATRAIQVGGLDLSNLPRVGLSGGLEIGTLRGTKMEFIEHDDRLKLIRLQGEEVGEFGVIVESGVDMGIKVDRGRMVIEGKEVENIDILYMY